MQDQWRAGTLEFIDFTTTLTDPDGELTLAEVEGFGFKIAVTQSQDTPAAEAFITPSVEPDITEDTTNNLFKVRIKHLFQADVKGLNNVWLTFGPTPERPIYLAVSFVVL
jgi:hypothetical protein